MRTPTRVLFYADPPRLYESFARSADVLANHLMDFVGSALLASGRVEMKAVVSEIAAWQARDDPRFAGIELIPFSYDELGEVFAESKSLEAMMLRNFGRGFTDVELRRFRRVLSSRLGDWEPDVVICYPTNASPFRTLYPEALCLTGENGLFSRGPFPRSLRYDAIDFMNGFPNRFGGEIRRFAVSAEEREDIVRLREGLNAILAGANPQAKTLAAFREAHRQTVLVPVPASNIYGEAAFDDQFLWLRDVLKHLPREIGVVATFHDNVGAQLSERTVAFLQDRHPNLLAMGGSGWVYQSLWCFPYVDAVLNCESMTGLLGQLMGTRLVALDRTYSAWAADGVGLGSLSDVLSAPPSDRAPSLAWLLTHYTVLERRFNDADWYFDFFERKLRHYRSSGIDFGLYERVERLDEVVDYLLKVVHMNIDQVQANLAAERRNHRKPSQKLGRWLVRQGNRLQET